LHVSTVERDLPLLVRLLLALRVTGRLQITQDRWMGAVYFAHGRMVAATFGAEQGLPALEALLLALPDGRCTFHEGVPAPEANIELAVPALLAEMHRLSERRAHLVRRVPSLRAIPRARPQHNATPPDEEVTLPRSALATLAAIDGRQGVAALCRGRGLVRTLEDLALLVDLGLISVTGSASLAHRLSARPTGLALGHCLDRLTSGAGRALERAVQRLRCGEHILAEAAVQLPARAHHLASRHVSRHMLAGAPTPAPPGGLDREYRDEPARTEQAPAGYGDIGWGQTRRRRRGNRWVVVAVLTLLALGLILALCQRLGMVVQPQGRGTPDEEVAGSLGSPVPGLSGGRVPPEPSPSGAAVPPALGAAPTPAAAPGPAPPVPPAAATVPPAPSVAPCQEKLRTVLAERFASTTRPWPNHPDLTAWLAEGAYRLAVRQPGQFVAIGAPVSESFGDVIVSARVRQVGGPLDGQYGLIVRDQGPGPRDGVNQTGRFYVLVVDGRGEVGILRREADRWLDLVPRVASAAVRAGNATNDLVALAIGQQLGFMVNGTLVASVADRALGAGAVGVYAAGDFTEVAIEEFLVQVPCY
jgi:hypothetical protein